MECNCKWAVCYDIDASTQDDRKQKTEIVAIFGKAIHAEEFIEKCLPGETRNRFYVLYLGNITIGRKRRR